MIKEFIKSRVNHDKLNHHYSLLEKNIHPNISILKNFSEELKQIVRKEIYNFVSELDLEEQKDNDRVDYTVLPIYLNKFKSLDIADIKKSKDRLVYLNLYIYILNDPDLKINGFNISKINKLSQFTRKDVDILCERL